MKTILIPLLLICLISCSGPKGDSSTATETPVESEDNNDIEPIPEFGILDFEDQWLDSMRSYGAGDCLGEIYHYTKQDKFYAADSLDCGEYGFTFTHFLLDSANFLLKVRELKWESKLDESGDDYTYVLSEHIYDFQRDSEIIFYRSDTLSEHYLSAGYPEEVQKPFERQSLELKESIYETLMFRYQKAWQR